MSSFSPKIRSLDQVCRWRAEVDGVVVLTNGVFDLLHAGHVHLLERARDLGDALIVAVNSDASVRELGKGEDRPINGQDDRAMVLAAIEVVNCVFLFDESTPERCIDRIRPDVLVKGSEYSHREIPGRTTVEGYGGRVVCIEMAQGYSTTSMLRRIRRET